VLRPDVVLFGEPIPEAASLAAHRLVAGCGSLLVVGTSCEVFPASMFPAFAQGAGAAVIEVNPLPTSLTPAADISLRGRAGDVLPELERRLE
jgi:NAD-dependent deacetylase